MRYTERLRASQTCYCYQLPAFYLNLVSQRSKIINSIITPINNRSSRSLTELTRQITPPTKNGHAPPPTESRKSSQSVNPSSVRAWWDFPCWVKLSRRLHSWWCPSVNSFKFQSCDHTSPGTQKLWFPGSCQRSHRISACTQKSQHPLIASWHRLWLELQRYLIVFDPPTFALD